MGPEWVLLVPCPVDTDLLSAVGVFAHIGDDHDLLLHHAWWRLVNGRARPVVVVKRHLLLFLVGERVDRWWLGSLYAEGWRLDALGTHVVLLLVFHVVLEVAGRRHEVGAAWEVLQL